MRSIFGAARGGGGGARVMASAPRASSMASSVARAPVARAPAALSAPMATPATQGLAPVSRLVSPPSAPTNLTGALAPSLNTYGVGIVSAPGAGSSNPLVPPGTVGNPPPAKNVNTPTNVNTVFNPAPSTNTVLNQGPPNIAQPTPTPTGGGTSTAPPTDVTGTLGSFTPPPSKNVNIPSPSLPGRQANPPQKGKWWWPPWRRHHGGDNDGGGGGSTTIIDNTIIDETIIDETVIEECVDEWGNVYPPETCCRDELGNVLPPDACVDGYYTDPNNTAAVQVIHNDLFEDDTVSLGPVDYTDGQELV